MDRARFLHKGSSQLAHASTAYGLPAIPRIAKYKIRDPARIPRLAG